VEILTETSLLSSFIPANSLPYYIFHLPSALFLASFPLTPVTNLNLIVSFDP